VERLTQGKEIFETFLWAAKRGDIKPDIGAAPGIATGFQREREGLEEFEGLQDAEEEARFG
jgi:hypothetical protein